MFIIFHQNFTSNSRIIMVQKSFLLIIMFACIMTTFSQNSTDSIIRVRTNNGFRYRQAGRLLNVSDFKQILSKDKTSLKYFRNAQTLGGFAYAFSYTGGFCIGYPIGYAISGHQMNWSLFAMGCGFVMLAIPISIAGNNKLKMAVDTYNGNLKPRPDENQLDVKLGCTQHGIGITLTL